MICVQDLLIFPYGNYQETMRTTVQQIGTLIRATRKGLGVTQKDLALTSGTGLRFVVELERGKETCEMGKVLTILQTLGIKLALTPPHAAGREE
jgi:y4mF family transcriptional regulator